MGDKATWASAAPDSNVTEAGALSCPIGCTSRLTVSSSSSGVLRPTVAATGPPASETEDASSSPLELVADDERLVSHTAVTVRESVLPEPHGRLYTVRPAEDSAAEIDVELDERLRALGYTGD